MTDDDIHPTEPVVGRWLQRGERQLYRSDWVTVAIADVVMPDGTQVDHHLVRMPRPAAGTVMVRDGRVLLVHRHRFITDTWGWEIPAGGIDASETPAEAAIREAREETGWAPRSVRPLCRFHPAVGILDQTFHVFVSDDAVDTGRPADINEAPRLEWLTIAEVRALLADGEVTDCLTFGGLCYALAVDALTG